MQSNSPDVLRNVEYPPPPRLHWTVLLISWVVLASLFEFIFPPAYQKLLNSLIIDAWAFRLCVWIRNLDPDSRSPFWCDVYVVVELAYALVGLREISSPAGRDLVVDLGLLSFCLGLWTIYLIRSDLLKHYNGRERRRLELNGVMTYFFSFLYFQSQLYPIAQAKKREAEERAGAAIYG